MPLKKEYLGHSLLLQQLYIAVMAEKISNELSRVSYQSYSTPLPVEPKEKEEELKSCSSASIAEGERLNVQSATTTISTTTHSNTNMLFHDRMDLLEQELYRVKKKSKKRLEDIQLYQDELAQQVNELTSWKLQSEQSRRSERVWMLMVMVSVIFGIVSLRTFFFF
ncbi:uncharacterized protein B0P05DRAFT_477575 [Gilbertella persicaria]|nr:uncharacterized protein B0P05DRAFT_477575 [Gilbertella persicaria]KAI8061523.1 hypothetical protein B0P05DRAFT_477575 [Gilbertella persicaria]